MDVTIPFEVFREKFFENLPYKVMWMNEEGHIIYANKKFYQRLGYSKSELKRLTIFDINPTSTAENWKEHWKRMGKELIHSFKAVHQTKSGKYYDVEISAQFFSYNGKKIIAAIVNDISESSFYKNLLNHAERMTKVGGWKLNLQDGSIIVTEQAMQIFDSENQMDFLPGQVIRFFKEKEDYKTLLSKAIRKGASFDVVLTCNKPQHKPRFIRCVCDPIIKGKKIYKLVGAYQDVTEEINKQNELSTFKFIIDKAQDLIYFRDQQHDFKYANEAFLKYIRSSLPEHANIQLEEIINKNEQYFWPNRSRPDMDALWERVEKEGTVNTGIVYQKEGRDLYFQSTVLKITYKDEKLTCGITRDITDIKENELQLRNALKELSDLKTELEIDNQYLREEISQKINLDNIICQSDAYRKVLELVTQVAVTDSTVLITGESGTGKELLASAVHLNSLRNERPLIKVNCATLPKDLIESELFGHKKGAFTGATDDKLGKFSLADGGTIFLDEIGEVPIDLQPKLLRVLQEGEFDQLGATKTTKVDVRIIAATNRNLEDMVNDGDFREDLFYRLNVFPIHNIPLRDRKDDIPLLAQFFLDKYSTKAGKSFRRLSKKTIDLLMTYNFPGNIRELENLIERAVIIENGTTLKPGSWLPKQTEQHMPADFKPLDDMQKHYIIDVLNHTNWRVSGPKGAARILGMKDKTLFARMKKLGIEKTITFK